MVFSASPLIKVLFLFGLSFITLLVASGLTVALYRFQLIQGKQRTTTDLPRFSSRDLSDQNVRAHQFDSFLLLISFVVSLLFTSFISTHLLDSFILLGITILLFLASSYSSFFSLLIQRDALAFRLPLWSLVIALLCLGLSFVYFTEGSFFLDYFPFWADRLLGAALLFCFLLMFQRFSTERFGLHISFSLVAFCFALGFFVYKLSGVWLELSLILFGLTSAALYWVFCFGGYKLEKPISLSFGFFLGFFLLKIMTLGATWPPLILFFIGFAYLSYPYLKTACLKIRKSVF